MNCPYCGRKGCPFPLRPSGMSPPESEPHPAQEKCRHDDVRGLVRVLRLMPVGAVWSFDRWGSVTKTKDGYCLHRLGTLHRRNIGELALADMLIPEVRR